jgi:ribosomal protein S18 acetylase RimI-like enzyme
MVAGMSLAESVIYDGLLVRYGEVRDDPFLARCESHREWGAWDLGDFAHARLLPGCVVKVLEWQARPVAHAVYQHRGDDEVALLTLAVHPLSRGRGWGRLLLDAVKAKVRPGAGRLVAHVRERDLASQTFLRHEGVRAVAVRPAFFLDTGEDAYEFVWGPRP